MTIADRVEAFKVAYPHPRHRASWPWLVREQGRPVMYAVWMPGQNYRATAPLYGAYPPRFLQQLMALFPDAGDGILHAFAGALPPGPYSRIDLVDRCGGDDPRFHLADVCDAAKVFAKRRFGLVVADPPYSGTHAKRYGTPTINRPRAISALAAVTEPGRHLAWLDVQWPIHRKAEWLTVGRIYVQGSTNHAIRACHLFERAAA